MELYGSSVIPVKPYHITAQLGDNQKSEFLLEHGAIDMIVHRKDLRPKVYSLLSKLNKK